MRHNKQIHWLQVTRNETGYANASEMAMHPVSKNISNFMLKNTKQAKFISYLDRLFSFLHTRAQLIVKARAIAIHKNLNNFR